VHRSKSPNGPWEPLPSSFGCNNPAPAFAPNGTLYVLCSSSSIWRGENIAQVQTTHNHHPPPLPPTAHHPLSPTTHHHPPTHPLTHPLTHPPTTATHPPPPLSRRNTASDAMLFLHVLLLSHNIITAFANTRCVAHKHTYIQTNKQTNKQTNRAIGPRSSTLTSMTRRGLAVPRPSTSRLRTRTSGQTAVATGTSSATATTTATGGHRTQTKQNPCLFQATRTAKTWSRGTTALGHSRLIRG
jgi:hypothetical protein